MDQSASSAAEVPEAPDSAASSGAQVPPALDLSASSGVEAPQAPRKGNGKGQAKQPMPPPPPAGKGKGKAQGPAPPPKASAKGIGKGASAEKASLPGAGQRLPLGKRLNMKSSGALPMTARGERQDSIFQGLLRARAGSAEADIDVLQKMFAAPDRKVGRSSSSNGITSSPEGTPRAVLPDSVAKNCAIVLRGLPLQGTALLEAVKNLDPGPLDQDHLERLARVMPDSFQMENLKAAATSNEFQLRDVEQTLVPFARLGRLQKRLKALTLAANLKPQESFLMEKMESVRTATQQICNSNIFKQALATILVMFNYVNFGEIERSGARAFDITCLLQLNEFKAGNGPFPKFNAVHYVAMRLLADGTPLSSETLLKELGCLSKAAGIALVSVRSYVEELRREAKNLVEEQQANATIYGAQAPKAPPNPEPLRASAESTSSTPCSMISEASAPAQVQRSPNLDFAALRVGCGLGGALGWLRRKVPGPGAASPRGISELARNMLSCAPEPSKYMLTLPDSCERSFPVTLAMPAVGLLCYSEMPGSVRRPKMRCVPIAGAVVGVLDPSANSNKFEVALPRSPVASSFGRRLVLEADDLQVAFRWRQAIQTSATAVGAGWLQLKNKFGLLRWRWVVLQVLPFEVDNEGIKRTCLSKRSRMSPRLSAGSRCLSWYRSPEDVLLGEAGGCFELGPSAEVFLQNERRCTFSISVLNEDFRPTQTPNVVFRARTLAEQQAWMRCLRGEASATVPLNTAPSKNACKKVVVPRLNLTPTSSDSGSADSGSVRSLPTIGPLAPASRHDTLVEELRKNLITPRATLVATPRIDEAPSETDTDTTQSDCQDSTDSASETGEQSTTITPVTSESPSPVKAEPEVRPKNCLKVQSALQSDTTTYARMTELTKDVEASAKRLEKSLDSTLEEGKQLLRYLGQKADAAMTEEDLSGKVKEIYETVSKFSSMLKVAVTDVERHQSRRNNGFESSGGGHLQSLDFSHRRRSREAEVSSSQTPEAPLWEKTHGKAPISRRRSFPGASCAARRPEPFPLNSARDQEKDAGVASDFLSELD